MSHKISIKSKFQILLTVSELYQILTSIKRNLGQQNIGNRQAFQALKRAFPSQTLRDLAARRAAVGGGSTSEYK